MADSRTPTESTDPNSQQPKPDNPDSQTIQSDPPSSSSPSTSPFYVPPHSNPNSTPPPPPPLPPPPLISPPQQPSIQSYSAVPPTAPSFRPAAPPVQVPSAPQYSPLLNSYLQAPPNYQTHGVQPPGVMMPLASYAQLGQLPNPPIGNYAPMPNGYPAMPQHAPLGTFPPAGIPRYPSPYTPMFRPAFPPRPPFGIIPSLLRPPVPVIHGPIIPPVVRPAITPSVTPAENPQTTVYVGKIASTVENEFMLSLLQVCGIVKSWKRVQDPTNGTLKGFGFCEFDSAEGVLRALRLLSKLNIDGQELMLNVNQATREYLGHYVQKKTESSKNPEATETEEVEKAVGSASGADKNEALKPSVEPLKPMMEDSKKDDNDTANKENHDNAGFGLVTDEEREADQEAVENLTSMIEDRLKMKPLPPPPPQTPDGSGNSNLELPAKSRDEDSDVDIMKKAEDTKDDEMTSESKPPSEHDRPETSSPDRGRKNDRRSRDQGRDLKRDKERELERYEREREQERAKREREREYTVREDERRYKARVKQWESRERDNELQWKLEKEKEKEREQERKWEIQDQEREYDDGYSKKRKYRSSGEEKKRRRQREKEEDLADRLKEEEEIAEAKRKAEVEQQKQKQEKDALMLLHDDATSGSDNAVLPDETNLASNEKAADRISDGDAGYGNHIGDGILQNGSGDESIMGSIATSEMRQSSNTPTRKLGFGIVGSGKRTSVPSVFHEEDEDAQKEKKLRPLVPIDYTEEVQAAVSGVPSPKFSAAAEFAKHLSNVNPKEVRSDAEKERSRRPHYRSSRRDRDRNDENTNRTRDESRKEAVDRDRDRGHVLDKAKPTDNQKLLDAKELIDMIPKTKDELFSYEIDWAVYDKNGLHERMRPWISKKITEYLGEDEPSLVDFVVSSIQDHVKGSEMLEKLQSILDEEAEMFVLKMWRMLIFEIKKVEAGLALRTKS